MTPAQSTREWAHTAEEIERTEKRASMRARLFAQKAQIKLFHIQCHVDTNATFPCLDNLQRETYSTQDESRNIQGKLPPFSFCPLNPPVFLGNHNALMEINNAIHRYSTNSSLMLFNIPIIASNDSSQLLDVISQLTENIGFSVLVHCGTDFTSSGGIDEIL